MQIRVLELDGSASRFASLVEKSRTVGLAGWGPRLRLASSFGAFRRFERDLEQRLGPPTVSPALTFVGSGDFHHVSLALVRRLKTPFNLLVLDNHPDWMRGLPFVHCGNWLHHAGRLPLCRNIYHVGGAVDFDNGFRWLAPWRDLRSGRLSVFPAVRRFAGKAWQDVPHQPLRAAADEPATPWRLRELLAPHRAELSRRPLYVSLDKDVLTPAEAIVNWDSGRLKLAEVLTTLTAFTQAAEYRLAGMDIVGDWSPVETSGLFRKTMHWLEHPRLNVNAEEAERVNRRTNRRILLTLEALAAMGRDRANAATPLPVRSTRRAEPNQILSRE